ncbi:alpha-mannosidase [Neobacillus ginsengisoli]|uniref:Alpha-mannosidase n=1 Tax=Neobacillus ginsengisoli TaxID=904295 RepID=A0ABT9Y3J0_9BACI|nr:alpha-mannosidase [Neobacillus ginsengisoli]
MNEAKSYGHVSKLGYFPDTFGIYGQAPQLLKQAGIDIAAFGRGVKPTGFNNTVSDSPSFESPFSKMVWKSH